LIESALAESVTNLDEALRLAYQAGLPLAAAVKGRRRTNSPSMALRQIVGEVVATTLVFAAGALLKVLDALWDEAWAVGAHSAAEVSGAELPEYIAQAGINWDAWQPGDPAAARIVASGGLQRLREDAGLIIKGINTTTEERITTAIADGIARGAGMREVAAQLDEVIHDGARAEMIARTETARAVTAATFETYRHAGIGLWEWMDAPGACPICVHNTENSPYPLGGGPALPAHPNCRCAAAPVPGSIRSGATA
jgi:SPP1 gp7 family putative phage head morphogenesis protein